VNMYVVILLLALATAQRECTTDPKDVPPHGRLTEDPIYIVRFKPSMPIDELKAHITSVLGHIDQVEYLYQHTIIGYAARLTVSEMKSVTQHPLFEAMELDGVMHAWGDYQGSSRLQCTEDPDPRGAGSWGLTRVSQPLPDPDGRYFYSSANSAPVDVYIIDTGIYIQHQDFGGRAQFLYISNNAWQCRDGHGHGTHVASTTGGKYYGLHRGARLLAVKVLSDGGSGSTAGVIAGVDYAAGRTRASGRPSVGNMSLGGGRSAALNAAVAASRTAGVYMVVAAGNDNSDACNYSPASETSIITVLSTEEGPPDVRSSFSNWGTCVDIGAPGTSIRAAWIGNPNAVNTISGTSMASPHVAGLASTIIAADPTLPFTRVDQILLGTTGNGLITMNCPTFPTGNRCPQTPNLMGWNGCDHSLAI